jgi:hypothetical protein
MSRGQGPRRHASAARRPGHARPRWRRSSQARQLWPPLARRRESLDAQGLPEQHDGSRRSPILSCAGTLRARGWRPPTGATGPISPPRACGWGPPTLLHPRGNSQSRPSRYGQAATMHGRPLTTNRVRRVLLWRADGQGHCDGRRLICSQDGGHADGAWGEGRRRVVAGAAQDQRPSNAT